jgi:prepilin-type processing-associated H-X9-DG protein
MLSKASQRAVGPSQRAVAAFTLVELLIVIGIITVLIGILLPVLGKARAASQDVQCQSNLRQWGLGIALYVQQYNGYVPSEGGSYGYSSGSPLSRWDDGSSWFNIPTLFLEKDPHTYYDLATAYQAGTGPLPGTGDSSIYVCPAASAAAGPSASDVDNGYFDMYGIAPGAAPGSTPVKLPTYWCYIYNAGVSNYFSNVVGGQHQYIDAFGVPHEKENILFPSSSIVIMCEHMMNPGEVSGIVAAAGQTMPTQLNTGKTEARSASTCLFSARHNMGGHLLFVDGHVGFETYSNAITKTTDNVGKGYNRPDLIWEPGYSGP